MEEEAFLPEEILVFILTLLPVKSLIRFACVSKRFHFIILSDPDFAKAHLKAAHDHKTLTHRFLFHQVGLSKVESVDLDTPAAFGDHSSVRQLKLPFDDIVDLESPRGVEGDNLLGSVNGIVFQVISKKMFYMWNPSTGFFKQLPSPPFENEIFYYGVGYFPAIDDYKVFIYCVKCVLQISLDDDDAMINATAEAAVFSTRANAWKILRVSPKWLRRSEGILFNQALHWMSLDNDIVAFDLVEEEEEVNFEEVASPPQYTDNIGDRNVYSLGVSSEGFLSLARYWNISPDCNIDVWVMKVYGVRDSWTCLVKLKVSIPGCMMSMYNRVWVMETSTVVEVYAYSDNWIGLIKIDHKEEGKLDIYKTKDHQYHNVRYQETLMRIGD